MWTDRSEEMKHTIPQLKRGAVPSIFSSYIGEVSMIVDRQ